MAVLVFLTLAAILVGGLLAQLAGVEDDVFWWTWLRFTDPGYVGEDFGAGVRAVSILVTVTGWVVFGLLISIFSTAIQDRLGSLRRGAAFILDRGHTVVLGWNSTVFAILDQLWSSDEGDKPATVAVLADHDKEQMEKGITRYCLVPETRQTICRRGAIQSIASLMNCNLPYARQVIILGAETTGDDDLVDSAVLKAVLACSQVFTHCPRGSKPVTVVAAIQAAHTRELVRPFLEDQADHMDLMLVEVKNILARIIAQCAWQPGLALVYRDLLTYTGDLELGVDIRSSEIYCVSALAAGMPSGMAFKECLQGFPKANVIGYARQGEPPVLNPLVDDERAQAVLSTDDKLLFIADRRQDVYWGNHREHTHSMLNGKTVALPKRSILLLGQGNKADVVLQQLLTYLPAASEVVASMPGCNRAHGRVMVKELVAYSLNDLLEDKLAYPLSRFDTIVLVEESNDPDRHDAHILSLMSAIRAACRKQGYEQPVVVAELYDPRNRELAAAVDVRDIVISTELVSNFMVQLAREPERSGIYQELMDEAGMEFYIRPIEYYCDNPSQEICFADIMHAAAGHRELAIGYLPKGAIRAELSPVDRWKQKPAGHYYQIVVIAESDMLVDN